ncbi:MAG: Smr/MutS family protein [Deltaproteobacteria bacterium]|nr:Smr/MutS family protein [Deltaproteobacteria bacterium]
MKPPKSPLTHRPFQDLKVLLQRKSITLPDREPEIPEPNTEMPEEVLPAESEEELFAAVMKDVKPIPREERAGGRIPLRPEEDGRRQNSSRTNEEKEILTVLEDLIRKGAGFQVSETPEYVEGTGYDVPSEIARRLHRGDYAIQAHVDLHGFSADAARGVFGRFLKWAVLTGKRGILIIHGRGLSSPSGPVLKDKVIEWLTHGPWRKWIIAYASARACDGGAGATYVLLRIRPASKTKRRPPEKFH